MKKSLIVITVILVIVAAFSLTACSNTPLQSVLQTPWNEYNEYSSYEVYTDYDNEELRKSIGHMDVSYVLYKDLDLDIKSLITDKTSGEKWLNTEFIAPEFTLKEFNGFVVTTSLKLDDGQYKYSIVILDKQLKTKYSLAKSSFKYKNGENEALENIELEYKYDKKSCSYVLKGNNADGKIDKKATIKYKEFAQLAYFDNAYYIALTRSLVPVGMQAQLNFLTPSYRDDSMLRRMASASVQRLEVKPHASLSIDKFKQPEKKEDKTTLTCYINGIASGETMPGRGADLKYLIASVPYIHDTDKEFYGALIRFDEHNITYMLTDMRLEYNQPVVENK